MPWSYDKKISNHIIWNLSSHDMSVYNTHIITYISSNTFARFNMPSIVRLLLSCMGILSNEDDDHEITPAVSPFQSPHMKRKVLHDHVKHPVTDSSDGSPCCSICLEALSLSSCYIVIRCAHMFHVTCMNSWRAVKQECPLCKGPCGGISMGHDLGNYELSVRRRLVRGRLAAMGNWWSW